MAVLHAQARLLRERDVGRNVFLSDVQRTQHLGPASLLVAGAASIRPVRRPVRGGQPLADLGNEGGQPRLVEHRRHLGLQAQAEAVGVVVHPSKEARRRLLWGAPATWRAFTQPQNRSSTNMPNALLESSSSSTFS